MSDSTNLLRIRIVNEALEDLRHHVVYVGGATVSMYKDRPASDARFTDDIDIVIEIATYSGYAAIEEQLRQKGFENDITSKVICRYKVQGIVVDIMPTGEEALGFKNRWYAEGFKTSIHYPITDLENIRIFTSVYFLASKLDAFNDRGKNDGRLSPDFEDIIYILNNRSTIWDEIESSPGEVKEYLKNEFSNLIGNDYFEEWISAHLDYAEQRRSDFILNGLRAFLLS